MAAPSSTVWGSIVTGDKDTRKGRIGIYTEVTSTNTETTVKVQVWFWSMYSVDDPSTSYYYNANATTATTLIGAVDINHTVATGAGWSTSNQTKLGEYSHTYARGTSSVKKSFAAKFTGIAVLGNAAMTATTSITVPALASYTVAYNANGGSGAPASQKKWYGKTLTLSSTKPVRTGYTFVAWALSKEDADTGTWYYKAGSSCGRNENLTLYAVWEANTYKVTYNANGGSGAPSAQTKTYGVNLTLSSTKPTRTNYTFKGWGTSASATTVAYAPGAQYTANSDITLYAIWGLSYVKPRITNLVVRRCASASNTALNEDGKYAYVQFGWACDQDVSNITIAWTDSEGNEESTTVSASGRSGTVNTVIGNGSLDPEKMYRIHVLVGDTVDYSYANGYLYGKKFPIDVLAGGNGVAFGKAAERSGYVEFGFSAVFNKSVRGNAFGLSTLPQIEADEDFNSYLEPGVYGVGSHSIAGSIKNNPAGAMAGRLIVCAATGGEIKVDGWSYIQQWYIPMTFTASNTNAIYVRSITRDPNKAPNYYSWLKFTGTNA